jgi:hypothetical protein
MSTLETDPKEQEVLRVRINPGNRHVRITDPAFLENWVQEFERIRAEIEQSIIEAVSRGELEVPIDPNDRFANTHEGAIRFMAHTMAQQEMQQWMLRSGIGIVPGINSGTDHNQPIEFIDDPSVPLFGHIVEE